EQPRVLERFPRKLEREALLRIHFGSFAWGDAEEERIEAGDIIEEGGATCHRLAGSGGGGGVGGGDVPGAGGDFVGGNDALVGGLPEGGEIGRFGKAARHADDGNRLVGSGAQRRSRSWRFAVDDEASQRGDRRAIPGQQRRKRSVEQRA